MQVKVRKGDKITFDRQDIESVTDMGGAYMVKCWDGTKAYLFKRELDEIRIGQS